MMDRVILSWSGGKDCALALREMVLGGRFETVALLTTFVAETDRVVMHGIPRFLVEDQARLIGLPLEAVFLEEDAGNDSYDRAMAAVLEKYSRRGFSGIAFGDLFLEDVRRYRESRLSGSGMVPLFPLWGKDTKVLAERFVEDGWRAIVTCVDTDALNGSFAGRLLDRTFLSDLPPGVDPAGENGEFHTFVFDGPIFREPVSFRPGSLSLRDGRFRDLELLRP